jgi:hypothetical protein
MTSWSAAAVWLTLMSVHHRNPLILYGGDEVMRIMSFLLIFSRAGETWSLDQYFALRAGRPTIAGTAWCTRLLQLQVSFVYMQAFLCKFSGATWRNGTAAYYAIEVPKYRRTHLPSGASSLLWSRVMTWGTMATECALGPFIWIRELRLPVLAAGVALHLGMELFMNLYLFNVTMLICLTLFIDPIDTQRLLRSVGL